MSDDYSVLQPTEISALLESYGIAATRQRREIARELLGRAQHITAERLMERLGTHGHRISKATVYNTLRLFVDRGVLREIHVDANCTVYDTNTRPHHHFLDVESGALYDIPINAVSFSELPAPPEGTVTDRVDVIVRVVRR